MRKITLVFVLLAAVGVAFAPVRSYPFIEYDDNDYLTANPMMQAGLNSRVVVWSLTAFHASNWHPLTWLSHALDVTMFGMNPGGHHVVNLLLHMAVASAFFLVCIGLTGRTLAAFCASLLFALHPLHVEVVAWVAERKELLATFLLLLSVASWTGYVRKRRPLLYAATVAGHFLALTAKPTAVVFPLLLLILDGWPLGRTRTVRFRSLLVEKLPFLVLSAAGGGAALAAQHSGGSLTTLAGFPLWIRLPWVPLHYLWYLLKACVPMNLAVFYPQPNWAPPWWAWIAALLGIAAVTLLLHRHRAPSLLMGWLWFLVTLFPVSGVFQVGGQAVADRYFYLPSLGLAMGVLMSAPPGLRCCRRSLLLLGLSLALVAGAATRHQVAYWRDTETLMRRAIAVTQNNYKAHDTLGAQALKRGNHQEMAGQFREGMRARRALGMFPSKP